ncbi:MAG: MaoC family dehydratase [Polyangiaceae bacterium]|jgi:hypothetical protein
MSATLTIDRDRIRRWAQFSGDYNPIHFEKQAARALGAADVVAHGMIGAVLAFQRLWDDEPAIGDDAGARTLQARLRHPIVVDEALRLVVKRGRHGASCSLIGPDDLVRVGATLRPAADNQPVVVHPDLPRYKLARYALASTDVNVRRGTLLHALPECTSFWLGLASCFFSEFLARAIEPLRVQAQRLLGLQTVAEAVAVQTSYAVTLDPSVEYLASDTGVVEYACTFAPGVMVPVEGGCMGDVTWTVSSGPRCVLVTSVGLLLKRNPSTSGAVNG